MAGLSNWIKDRDNDGHPDDIDARIHLDLDGDTAGREFWSTLLDVAAMAGVQMSALPLPLLNTSINASIPDGTQRIIIRNTGDLLALVEQTPQPLQSTIETPPPGRCLTSLFTIDGALTDRDGDLVPDGTRITFDLPDHLPADLGAALGNLAARIGFESGGVTLPLTTHDGPTFKVRPGDGGPELTSTSGGWIASGEPSGLAGLLNKAAADWPHVTAPETGGVTSALGWLRRALADDGPEPAAEGDIAWQLQWSAQWEIDRLWSAFAEQLLPRLDPTQPVKLTALASEPREIRRSFALRVQDTLHERGFPQIEIESVCSFKSGLSWLREIVVPALSGQPVAKIRIEYRRFETSAATLDPHTRWLQELFPGNELLAAELNLPLDAIEVVEGDGPVFRAEAFTDGGKSLGHWEFTPLHRTLPFVQAIPDSGTVCVTTGGLIAIQGDTRIEVAVPTDLETFWTFWQTEVLPRVLSEVDERGGPRTALQPCFGRLSCEVWISEPNSRLGIREENDSAAEALHEDIYFNTLDAIEMYGERQTGERTSAPGAVIPIVHVQPGITPHARVSLRSATERPDVPYTDVWVRSLSLKNDEFMLDIVVDNGTSDTLQRLAKLKALDLTASSSATARVTIAGQTVELRLPLPSLVEPHIKPANPPPMDINIQGDDVLAWASALAAYPEVTAWIEDHSYEGRPIVALALSTPTPGRLRSPAKLSAVKPTCLIVARHHANEISSTNAAFKLAHLCATDSDWRSLLDRVNIIILPYENPDGAALHAILASDPAARNWKHHPARYNALGTEFSQAFFDPDTRFGESRARPALWRRWLPDVIVDNHGVPSHEWVQPFAGFGSPPRFRVSYWIPQALLYGVIGYVDDAEYPEHRQAAMALREAVSSAVRETDVGELNDTIGESYRFWGQNRDPERFPGAFHNGMLWHIAGSPANPEGRGFASRFPRTTVLSWVTEVNDETADAAHLERTARAHLIANRAMLDLIAAVQMPELRSTVEENGSTTVRAARMRPLKLGPE